MSRNDPYSPSTEHRIALFIDFDNLALGMKQSELKKFDIHLVLDRALEKDTAMNGKTIEILNTDAEGRLILADALSYAQQWKPELIIDLATLTGAVMIALGKSMAGMMGTSEDAMEGLCAAGQSSFERVWRLPLDDEYDQLIRGKSADLQNLGGRHAGTVTAAQFLQHFVADIPWVHLDIAGTAWNDTNRPYAKGAGATGFGVRLLVRFLEDRIGR